MSDDNEIENQQDSSNLRAELRTVSPDVAFTAHQNAANVLRQSKEQYINEGAKGLILVNGGGAVALLAFLQAIWTKEDAKVLAVWVLGGTAFLTFGVVFAAGIFMARHRAYVKGAGDDTHAWYRLAHWYVPGASLLCFVVGVGLTILGGLLNLTPPKSGTDFSLKFEKVLADPLKPPKEIP